ncbi:diphosphomevalonate decarboxylase [Patescibacteria group bacterium]|nr:diphosphomevalonate decarboxylase [Patescibacteria group bacterium]
MSKTTARAFSNIALVKYWGKRDEEKMLPQNSSVSVTLSDMYATTTVEFSAGLTKHELMLNGESYFSGSSEYSKVESVLKRIKKTASTGLNAKVVSKNNFPTSAGFASSAAGLAALAVAASKAIDLSLSKKELSILARYGSGSASRSVLGGFVKWNRGEKDDGSDSYATEVVSDTYWPEFRILAVSVSNLRKKIKSSDAMRRTVATSPYYTKWPKEAERDVQKIENAIKKRDIKSVGEIAERSAFSMHGLMMTAKPPILYFLPKTIELINVIAQLREKESVNAYVTIDAGPQVKILCLKKDIDYIKEKIAKINDIQKIFESRPGTGPQFLSDHLF